MSNKRERPRLQPTGTTLSCSQAWTRLKLGFCKPQPKSAFFASTARKEAVEAAEKAQREWREQQEKAAKAAEPAAPEQPSAVAPEGAPTLPEVPQDGGSAEGASEGGGEVDPASEGTVTEEGGAEEGEEVRLGSCVGSESVRLLLGLLHGVLFLDGCDPIISNFRRGGADRRESGGIPPRNASVGAVENESDSC